MKDRNAPPDTHIRRYALPGGKAWTLCNATVPADAAIELRDYKKKGHAVTCAKCRSVAKNPQVTILESAWPSDPSQTS